MKIPLRTIPAALVLLIMIASCVKRQEILLYEEKGESIPAVDSLYDYSKKLYKSAQYKEAIQSSKDIIEKYPTSEKVDDALSLLLLSKYRLKDYKGIINSVAGKEKLYKGRSAEADILYITAQSLDKLGKKNDAAKTYFDILKLPIKTNLKDKSEKNLEKLIEKELTFNEVKKLASRYEKTSLGCFTLYYAARKGLSLGKEQEARKIYNHMKRLYPNNKLTLEIAEMLKGEKLVTLTGGAIGFLAPLTEEYGIFGKRVKKGFELALKGKSLKVISRDTRGSPIGAIQEIINLIKKENVFVVIGPILSMPMIAASGISNLLKVPIISPTATEEDISSIGPYVFQLNVGLGAQAREMAKYATGTLGFYKIAIFHPDDAYGNSLADIFAEEVSGLGAQIVARQDYPDGATDFKHQMKFIKDQKPEAIYIPCYPNEAVMIAPQLKYYKIRAKILGADGWHDEKVPIQGEKYVEGAIFTSNPSVVYKNSDVYRDFRKRYVAEYGAEPSRESALGYDTGVLLLKAISTGAQDTKSLAHALREMEPYAGASGVVNARGIFEGAVPFYTIKNGDIIPLR